MLADAFVLCYELCARVTDCVNNAKILMPDTHTKNNNTEKESERERVSEKRAPVRIIIAHTCCSLIKPTDFGMEIDFPVGQSARVIIKS